MITEKLGVNLYSVYIKELSTTWRRHTNQLRLSVDMPVNEYVVGEKDNLEFTSVPIMDETVDIDTGLANHSDSSNDNPGENITSTDGALQDVNQPTVSNDPMVPRRSNRTPKPVVKLNL